LILRKRVSSFFSLSIAPFHLFSKPKMVSHRGHSAA
jgi:hypothetical protein